MIPVLLAVALVGYLLGANHTAPRTSNTLPVARTAANSDPFVSEYPSTSGWSVASAAPKLPGLAIAQSLVLAPHGSTRAAGMIAGDVSTEGSIPLPALFVARLREVPRAEIVSLLDTQAYRYGHLIPDGSNEELTLYVIPRATGGG